MKKSIIIIAACALIAGPAAAQSIGEKTGVNELLGITPSTADFVKEAAISDLFEIETSKLAALRATDEATKNFANQMVTAHTKTSTQLKEAVSSDPKTPIPDTLDSSHLSKLEKLAGLNGEDFTKRYHDDQVTAHKNAVNLFERYAKGGDSASLKSWAAKTLPDLQHHLEMAQSLDKARS
jgi:putative membrane protein